MQAAAGQWEVIRKREPVAEVINDPDTDTAVAERLRLLQQARDFSVNELRLPDNDSYRSYTALQRDFVVWNVFAAPEFSVEPLHWCFPIAGCVSYRGYFSRDAAAKKADRLRRKGFDVVVGGVSAYSTLGRFDDPILSTMLRWDDTRLAAVLFHELAHQVLYVKDDSAFNESFATAVEQFGVRRWLEHRGELEKMQKYLGQRTLQGEVTGLVITARDDLESLYLQELDIDEMRHRKSVRLRQLSASVDALLTANGAASNAWFVGELGNAHLVSTGLYEGWLPAFEVLMRRCDNDIECFYAEAATLAALDTEERHEAMAMLK